MTEPIAGRIIGVARDYDALHAILRGVWLMGGMASESIDAVAGLPLRYTAKLLSPKRTRTIGKYALGPLLECLGVEIVIVESARPKTARRISQRQDFKADAHHKMLTTRKRGKHRFPSDPEFSRRMVNRRNAGLSAPKRQRIARIAAKARWAKVRARAAPAAPAERK